MLGVRLTQIPWFPGDTLQYPTVSYPITIAVASAGVPDTGSVFRNLGSCANGHGIGIGIGMAWHTLVICFANSIAKPQRQISGPPYQEARSNKLHLSCSPLANVSGKRRSDASGSLSLRHFFQAILAVCQDPLVGQK